MMLKLRFAVKDIIDVAGLETGCGNSDYRRVYQRKRSSAPCIQQLVDAGAIFIGKTKTTQFSEGQAPLQWYVPLAFTIRQYEKVPTVQTACHSIIRRIH